jgi:hypothetical protein
MFYQMNEGYLPLSGVWQDQTINVLVPREPAIKGINMVCSRDLLPMGMKFADYLATQRMNFGKELPKYQALADAPDILDSRPAHFFEFTWNSQGGLLHQMMIVVCVDDKILSLTATVPGGMDEAMRKSKLAFLKSFRFGAAPVEARNGTA